MWKRDLSAGCTGFTAAATLFGMVRYLAAPELLVAVLLVVCASAFLTAVICYAARIAKQTASESAAPRARAVPASSQAA
jgi:hypothetical protein